MRECDLRKVDDSAGDMVDVVAEDIQRDMGYRLDDLAIGQPGRTRLFKLWGPELPALHDDMARQFENGIGSWISRVGLPGIGEVLLGQPQLAADECVGAEAVGALIGLGDRERDQFTDLRAQASVRKRGVEAEVALERSRSVAQDSKEIRDHT